MKKAKALVALVIVLLSIFSLTSCKSVKEPTQLPIPSDYISAVDDMDGDWIVRVDNESNTVILIRVMDSKMYMYKSSESIDLQGGAKPSIKKAIRNFDKEVSFSVMVKDSVIVIDSDVVGHLYKFDKDGHIILETELEYVKTTGVPALLRLLKEQRILDAAVPEAGVFTVTYDKQLVKIVDQNVYVYKFGKVFAMQGREHEIPEFPNLPVEQIYLNIAEYESQTKIRIKNDNLDDYDNIIYMGKYLLLINDDSSVISLLNVEENYYEWLVYK